MRFESFSFGSIRIDGVTYEHDVVIDRGEVSKRTKKPFAAVPRRLRTYAVIHRGGNTLEMSPASHWHGHGWSAGDGPGEA